MIKAPLSVRIVLLVLVTSGILVGGMLATVYPLMVSDYEALVVERETAVINRVASELELSNQQRVMGLETFVTRLVTGDGQLLDDDALQSLLQRSSVANELFPDGLLILDAEATTIAESQYSPGRLGTNYADRPHFQRARQTKQSVISEPIIGRTTGLPLLAYLQPILSENSDIIGYVSGILNLANTPLVDKQDVIESDTSTVTLIIDPNHRLFVSMQERFDKPEPLPDDGVDTLVDAALSLSPAGSIVKHHQETYLVASRQLDSPNWIILRALPYSEVIAPAQTSFRHFLLIALIGVTIVGLAGAWIAHSLTRPIERITRRIEHMADNARFDSDFKEQGGPEVTALAHAMNRLANERKAADIAIHKAERFLSSVLESASEVSIIATDTAGVITAFNKGAENMLGYSSQEIVGKQPLTLLHRQEEIDARSAQLSTELGHSVEGFRVFVAKAEQHGSEKREWTYVHKEGHLIPVSMVVTVMRDSSGEKINGYLGIAENITERKHADKVKNEFISTVNHELRTPLTSISGALGLMLGGNVGELPDKARTLLETAHRNSKRLTHLINDLLDIEKIAEGKLHFDMQVHAVMPLLEQALEANQHYGSNRDITLSLAGHTANALINVDHQRFMQILANLLSNAIKFSPQGGEVILAVETTNSKVTVSVIDSGPGIADTFREQIFQRFAQADASDSRAKEGTGLGLAITRELVEHMGGRIDFESTEGNGSRFFFELPLVQSAEQPPWQSESNTGHQEAARILVVEDDKDIAKLLSILLNDAGYHVDTALTGADALDRLKQTHYDLISLDLMLPDSDGVDIIRLLRQQPDTADIPIVVVSARMEAGRLAINGDTTNIDWLAKPIDQQQLIGIVQQQLSDQCEHHPRILHIEDDNDLHEVVCAMAGDHFSFEAAHTIQEARTRLQQSSFDVVLLDIGLPDGSGWGLVADIRACQPNAKLVILSGSDMTLQQHRQVEAVLLKSRLTKETLINGINARIQSSRSTKQPPTPAG